MIPTVTQLTLLEFLKDHSNTAWTVPAIIEQLYGSYELKSYERQTLVMKIHGHLSALLKQGHVSHPTRSYWLYEVD